MRYLKPFLFVACLGGLFCAFTLPALAQDSAGLAPGFDKLSAKERTRIAKDEEEKARQDTAYQRLMRRAEEVFQQQRFEEALALYQQARAIRPYNVYPKVKIQDLQALMGRTAGQASAVDTAHGAPASPTVTGVGTAPSPVDIPKGGKTVISSSSPAERPRTKPEHPPLQPAAPADRAETPSPADAALGERWFREGQAVVLERTVMEEGRALTYRRVTHPWGQVFHFRDGLAVEERVWKARFGD